MNKTKPITSVIIDDEINNCEYLAAVLQQYCPNIHVQGMAHDAVGGIALIEKVKPELVFLDIKMPDATGFDLLESIPNQDFKVIFVTAYDQYAIKAIRYCAFDYLLKPVNILELKQAVGRITDQLYNQADQHNQRWNVLQSNIQSDIKQIALPTSERVIFVKITDIIRCKGDNNYTHVYLQGGDKVFVSRTLKEFEELLSDEGFIRVHQSHLVNKRAVKSYEKRDGGYLLLTDGATVSISRLRKDAVMKELSR